MSEKWRDQANCKGVDPNVFIFTDNHAGTHARAAKKYCSTCPVKQQCLDLSIQLGEREGVWGGMSKPERRKYRRKLMKGTRSTLPVIDDEFAVVIELDQVRKAADQRSLRIDDEVLQQRFEVPVRTSRSKASR